MGRKVLILEEEFLQKVDELRGDKSREEFVTLLIESYLKGEKSSPEDNVFQKIDGLKGDVSREEFISALIENRLERRERPSPDRYVTREEFLCFKKEIKSLLKQLTAYKGRRWGKGF